MYDRYPASLVCFVRLARGFHVEESASSRPFTFHVSLLRLLASTASFYILNTLGSKKSIFGSRQNFPRQSLQFSLKIHFFGLGWGTPPFRAPVLCVPGASYSS